MTLLVLAYLGGVLTILSPCILPVLPFVFARAGQSFLRSGLPMLLGMAITFALVAMLAAVGGAWAVHANQYGRYVALVILAAVRTYAAAAAFRRSADAAVRCARRAPLDERRQTRRAAPSALSVGAARHRHRDCCGRRARDRSSVSC